MQAVTLYAKQVLLCTKTVNSPTMAEPARNTAAHSNVQNREFAHAITKIGITAENAAVVPNMLLFPMIIVFLSTVNVSLSKKLYAIRTEAERYNSRFKQTGQKRLWVHGFNAAQNLNSVAHIALLAVALASVVTKSDCSYRCLKFLKRIA